MFDLFVSVAALVYRYSQAHGFLGALRLEYFATPHLQWYEIACYFDPSPRREEPIMNCFVMNMTVRW